MVTAETPRVMAKLLSDSTAKWLQEQRRKPAALVNRLLRTPFVSGTFGGWRQWHVSIANGTIRVRSGSLAWGGGHYAVWPSGRTVSRQNFGSVSGSVPVGATRFVVWYTTGHPCPLTNCPKHPNGTEDCPAGNGDPSSFSAGAGSVGLFSEATRKSGWTDFHVLATVTRTAEDAWKVNQIQTAEISVNAIVYPGETGTESEDEDTTDPETCDNADAYGNFPSDVDDTGGPGSPDDGFYGYLGPRFPSKTGPCW